MYLYLNLYKISFLIGGVNFRNFGVKRWRKQGGGGKGSPQLI